jgi:hypothetical protein
MTASCSTTLIFNLIAETLKSYRKFFFAGVAPLTNRSRRVKEFPLRLAATGSAPRKWLKIKQDESRRAKEPERRGLRLHAN